MTLCNRKDAPYLIGREGNPLAKSVDGICGGLPGDTRNHVFANRIDVAGSIILVFRRESMSAEIASLHPDATQFTQFFGCVELLDFGLDIESVTGLDFDRGHALSEERIEPWQ